MTSPTVTIIVARARNGVIGRDNALPWHLPEDLQHFKRTTMGHPVLMGRRTYESIGRTLPGRRIIVVSTDPFWNRSHEHKRLDSLSRVASQKLERIHASVLRRAEKAYAPIRVLHGVRCAHEVAHRDAQSL